jgi:transcriptional regulator with XRE-family HTH domain
MSARSSSSASELRDEHGLAQQQLAEKLEVTPRYVQMVEGGQENLTESRTATNIQRWNERR